MQEIFKIMHIIIILLQIIGKIQGFISENY